VYPGHFAAGLALKTIEPRSPMWALLVGVALLDFLFGVFVLFRVEGGTIGHLHIPLSHSLAMSLLWSALFAACFWRLGRRVTMVIFAAVMSHRVLDALSHRPDILLWPTAGTPLGYARYTGGLAGRFGALVCIGAYAWYVRCALRTRAFGAHRATAGTLIGLMYVAEYVVVH
jgi:membrane-bound metal-dependent hydrolase YbcI (DUF457 family)